MKYSRAEVHCKASAFPRIRFHAHTLTPFAGLVIFQKFFTTIRLKKRLRACFRGLEGSGIYRRSTVFLQLIVHVLLGFRELAHVTLYRDDPLVQRLLGLERIPGTSTLSRMLRHITAACVARLRTLLRSMVLERLRQSGLARVTLDFDGTVQSTRRHAEGTAVGYNRKYRGKRSYYPLFCTVAQTGQVLDVYHRPGNVHDSKGAAEFIRACVAAVRAELPGVRIEVRLDSAFFSDAIVTELDAADTEFSISVPFERFTELKRLTLQRRRWERLSNDTWYFESSWKPQVWKRPYRFLFVRTRCRERQRGPIQLDLFVPYEYGYEFKVIITNKATDARRVVAFHEGRGSQERLFGELKTACHLEHVPVRRLHGNQTYLLAGLFAHNLTRELQMTTTPMVHRTTWGRAALWAFEQLDTLRRTVIQRAGRLTQPGGILHLTMNAAAAVKERILAMLAALNRAS